MKQTCLALLALLGATIACADHNGLWKRSGASDYTYEFAEDWVSGLSNMRMPTAANRRNRAILNEAYQLCSIDTQQTPLRLAKSDGASRYHTPTTKYPKRLNEYLENLGTSLSYTLSGSDNTPSLPPFSFQESNQTSEEVYLIGCHLHTPSEHTIDGEPVKVEMHFVHADAQGNPRSVFRSHSIPSTPRDQWTMRLDPTLAIQDVGGFKKFYSYEGSLTTPPCTEGLRWFVSQEPLYVDNDTLQSILGVSRYSARLSQQRWMHGLNE